MQGDHIYFVEGWAEFVRDHKLHIGDFLVFKYDQNFIFDVEVFDASCCYKNVDYARPDNYSYQLVLAKSHIKNPRIPIPIEFCRQFTEGTSRDGNTATIRIGKRQWTIEVVNEANSKL